MNQLTPGLSLVCEQARNGTIVPMPSVHKRLLSAAKTADKRSSGLVRYEDAYQDAWLRILSKVPEWSPAGGHQTGLAIRHGQGAVLNTVKQRRQLAAREVSDVMGYDGDEDAGSCSDASLHQRWLRSHVESACDARTFYAVELLEVLRLNMLPQHYAVIVMLVDEAEQTGTSPSYAEVGRRLGRNRTFAHRAVQQARDILGPLVGRN